MTKRFGEHKYDKFIAQSSKVPGKKYAVQQKDINGTTSYFATIKDARDLISWNENGYRLAAEVGQAFGSAAKPAPGVQARPAAKAAPKVHVPKGCGKKPTPAKILGSWPFPTTTKLPLAKSPTSNLEQVTINGVLYELEQGLHIEFITTKHIRITAI